MSNRSGQYSEYPQHHPHDHGRPYARRTAAAHHAAAAPAQASSGSSQSGYTITHAGKQVRFGPVAFWIVVGTVTALGVWSAATATYFAFRDKHKLEVPLISDEKHQMLEAYGAWGEKSMYGRTFQGIIRTTVLIGSDGRVARIWRHVRVDGHADQVLAAAQAL